MANERTVGNDGNGDELHHLAANADWLLLLRWVAVIGQLATIGIVAGFFGVAIPWGWLIGGVAITAASNGLFALWLTTIQRSANRAADAVHVRRIVGGVMAFDIVALTVLLALAGGVGNPFLVFYLVNVTLCAVILSERWAWGLTAISLFGMLLLLVWHVRIPALTADVDTPWIPWSTRLTLAQLGQVVAVGGCALVIIHFVARVTAQLEMTAAELRRMERERSRSEKLEALGTLAGGAAHELATPLSTIAVVAKEMIHYLQSAEVPDTLREDMELIRTEVAHCQSILQRMTGRAGQWMTEQSERATLVELARHTLGELSQADRVILEMAPEVHSIPLTVPLESFAQALRGLLQNGLDASPREAKILWRIVAQPATVVMQIIDQGTGMSTDVLERAGEPFFTTKEPGRGMGLGLFLTRSVIERLGGSLQLESPPGGGVTATITLPREIRRR